MKLDGRVAIVTGGASGLGEATARRLVGGGALARDLPAVGVRVCTIAPGTFDTPIFDAPRVMPENKAAFQSALLADNAFPRRLGRAEEFAALVDHVIVNDMLNGEVIRLDAGARLRANPGR